MIGPHEIVPPGRLLAGLVARGLLAPSAALDHVVTLEDVSRSNPVTVVAVDGAAVLVVKQRGIQVDGIDPLAAEGAAYSWLARAGLEAHAPRLLTPVEEDGVLVLEALSPVRTLQELLVGGSPDTGTAFGCLGTTLGRLHRAPIDGTSLEVRRPWILELERAGLPDVVPATEVVTLTRGRILASSALSGKLARLRTSWEGRSVVHGDVKFDNVLVGVAKGNGPRARVWLVDWELAGLGEPGWDLAGVIEGTLTAQLMMSGRTDGRSAARLIGPALRAHRRVAGRRAAEGILSYVAARTAQAALQLAAMAATDPETTTLADKTVDLAVSLAEEPDAWALALLRTA